jgi:hypothetical protein
MLISPSTVPAPSRLSGPNPPKFRVYRGGALLFTYFCRCVGLFLRFSCSPTPFLTGVRDPTCRLPIVAADLAHQAKAGVTVMDVGEALQQFMGGLLRLVEQSGVDEIDLRATGRIRAGPLARMSGDQLNRALAFAAACAAVTCGRPGADPSPRL